MKYLKIANIVCGGSISIGEEAAWSERADRVSAGTPGRCPGLVHFGDI